MESSTEISTPQLPSEVYYEVYSFSKIEHLDSIRIITPHQFAIDLTGRGQAIEFLIDMLRGGEMLSPDGSRLNTNWQDRDVSCIDTDTWLNASTPVNGSVADPKELCLVIMQNLYLLK